jgi:VIT1/CCC1 family predicted Fe2+/Mn2+ transporter
MADGRKKSERGHLRDLIYGGIDGAVTTFAIVAGVEGAGLSPRVIIALGIANVLADGFSMAAGNYSGTKAELDENRRLRSMEAAQIELSPATEREELRRLLADKGLSGTTLNEATDAIASRRETWIETMLFERQGLSPVDPAPMAAAIATFLAFLVAGLVPLAPFLLAMENPFSISIALTLAVFAGIGAAKSHWSLAPWWRSSLETLAIGGTAALIAYIVGSLFEQP